jgi:hypothetical protein
VFFKHVILGLFMNNKQSGASLIEMSLSIIVVLTLMLGVFDLARVAYTKCMLRVALTETLKKSQGNLELIANVWSLPSSDLKVKEFLNAREALLSFAASRINFGLLPGVKIIPVSHFDTTLDNESEFNSNIAFLPPGYSAKVQEWNIPVHNPNRCSPRHISIANDNEQDALFQSCTGIRVRKAGEELTDLVGKYPTVLATFFEMDTLFFGHQTLNVQVAGYQQTQSSFEIPPTATPTPAPSAPRTPGDACETGGKTTMCIGKKTYEGSVVLNGLYDRSFTGTARNPAVVRAWLEHENSMNDLPLDAVNSDAELIFNNNDICFPINQSSRSFFVKCNETAACDFLCWRTAKGCFAKDTKVTLADGTIKNIQDIIQTDKIRNPLTGKVDAILKLVVGPEKHPLIEITIGKTSLKVTQKHPFITKRGLLQADEILLDDEVLTTSSEYQKITGIKVLPIEPNQMVYNIDLASNLASPTDRLITIADIVTPDFTIQKKLEESRK